MMMRAAIYCLVVSCQLLAVDPLRAQPQYQYESEGIRIPRPSSDEPRVTQFGAESLLAAAKYIEDGALSWARGNGCVNCHTTGPYLAERTAWTRAFGAPSEVVLETFRRDVPAQIVAVKEVEQEGHRYYPGAFSSVWRSLGLAEWDRHITHSTSEWTDRSLRDMFQRQSSNGAFVSHGEVEIPHITTDFELSLQAARAMTAAPGWLESLSDPELLSKVERFKHWLRTAPPKNDFDRVLRLQLHRLIPELVTDEERRIALDLLTAKQHEDGGWSTRDMSAVRDWHFQMSDKVLELLQGLPDAAQPESDAYMTALAIVLLRQADVPVDDPRIQSGLRWLKQEQRVSGRWWMHSLYRGNYHFTTYIATVETMKALDLCGELQTQ